MYPDPKSAPKSANTSKVSLFEHLPDEIVLPILDSACDSDAMLASIKATSRRFASLVNDTSYVKHNRSYSNSITYVCTASEPDEIKLDKQTLVTYDSLEQAKRAKKNNQTVYAMRGRYIVGMQKADGHLIDFDLGYYLIPDNRREFPKNQVVLSLELMDGLSSREHLHYYNRYATFTDALHRSNSMRGKNLIVKMINGSLIAYVESATGIKHSLSQENNTKDLVELLKLIGSTQHLMCLEKALFNDCKSFAMADNRARKFIALRLLTRYLLSGPVRFTSTKALDGLQSEINKFRKTDLKYLRRHRRSGFFPTFGNTHTWQEIPKIIAEAKQRLEQKLHQEKEFNSQLKMSS